MSQEWFASAQILTGLSAPSSAIGAEIGVNPGGSGSPALGPHLPFDRSLKDVIREAPKEAERLGARMVGTGHLLLALLGQGRGRAADVLDTMGISYRAVDEELRGHAGVPSPRGTANPPVDRSDRA